MTSQGSQPEQCDLDSWDPLGDDYKSPMNNLILNPDKDPMSQITGKVRPIDSKIGHVTLCEHFARYGNCVDGEYCDRLHVDSYAREKIWDIQNQCELNKNRLCLTSTYLSAIELEPDKDKLLLVSIVKSNPKINNFHVIAPYENLDFSRFEKDDIEFYIDNIKSKSIVAQKQARIHNDLKLLFDHEYRVDNPNDEIYLSQIVACKDENGKFRRAMILTTPKLNGGPDYDLFLIDTGAHIELPRNSIYDIKAEYLSEPPLAINARLPLKPTANDIEWSEESKIYFEIWTDSCDFYLTKIISYSEMDKMFTIDLINYETHRSLVDDMVRCGLADMNY